MNSGEPQKLDSEYHPVYPEIEPVVIGGKKYYNISKKKKPHPYLQNRGFPDGSDRVRKKQRSASAKSGRSDGSQLVRIYKAHKGICFYCRVKISIKDATRDHKIPRSKGGSNEDWNILLACTKCNTEKGNMDYDEYYEICLKRRQEAIEIPKELEIEVINASLEEYYALRNARKTINELRHKIAERLPICTIQYKEYKTENVLFDILGLIDEYTADMVCKDD